jgi:hypothetical protein
LFSYSFFSENPSQEGAEGYVFLFMPQESGGVLAVRYVPDSQKYDFKIDNLSGEKTGYSYDAGSGTYDFGDQTQEEIEGFLTAVLGEPENGDPPASPAAKFHETIRAAFGISADALYALPAGI